MTSIAGLGVAGMLATFALTAPPASALFGDAVIDPVESNIAAKSWASATASSATADAALAIDQDEATAWIADAGVSGQWLSLYLGGAYDNIRKVEVLFADSAAVHQFEIQVSADGASWTTVLDARDNTEASGGAVALLTEPGTEYVRVLFADASDGATIGVRELRAYNYLRDDLVLGADLSYVDDFQNRTYWVDPLGEDRGAGPHLLDVVQDRGMDFIRLRIWNEPRNENNGNPVAIPRQGPERSLDSARWIKLDRDMGLGIDFHYADSWADPGKQPKPLAWAQLPFDELEDAIYEFTYDYIQQLIDQGTTPDKVAVGNEIINGFLWGSENEYLGRTSPAYWHNQRDVYQSQPGGGLLWNYWGSDDPAEQQLYNEQWDRFSTLVASGMAAVRDVSSDNGEDIDVEIHVIIDNNRLDKTLEFWDQLLTRLNAKGQDPDVLAHSYYPEWHGTPEYHEMAINQVAAAHPSYKLDIAETSYPASGGGGSPLPNSPFPRTIQGQADAIQHVFQIANDIPDNRGVGVLTWEPASWQTMFRSVPGQSNTYEPHSSIDIYNLSHATHVRTDRVHVTAEVGGSVSLPSTIPALTTASGEIADIAVAWEQVPPGTTSETGTVTVRGSSDLGPVEAIISVVAEILGQPTGDADATQTIIATLEEAGGALVISVDANDRVVVLPAFELSSDGASWFTSGALRPVTVTDTRSSVPGWSASGQVTDFVSVSGDSFAGSALGWAPTVIAQPNGMGVLAGPAVAPGFPAGDGLSVSQTLASAPAGSGFGTTQLGAELNLQVATDLRPGTYSAIITFTAM